MSGGIPHAPALVKLVLVEVVVESRILVLSRVRHAFWMLQPWVVVVVAFALVLWHVLFLLVGVVVVVANLPALVALNMIGRV